MECPKCQTENPDTRRFCRECGTKIVLVCPQCKTENLPDDKFCGNCGHDLRKPKESPDIDYNRPESYTPKHLAEKILISRSSVEGERKLVTILFADVANSTAMFEKLDPEQVHEIMDGCFRILMDEIHRYEGTINQFRGDGVMALFGAPISHEDHAQKACHAALAIQKALVPYAGKLHNEYGVDFKMRIGLNSGSVVVGAIGDDLRMDYTAQGDTANLAARMESNAAPGNVLVSENSFRLASGYFDFESPGEIQVKGKTEPVKTYQLLRPTKVATRIAASAAKGLTRFVGRKREIETLKEAFDKAASEEGQVVGVVGEAGVGKSRLLLEFRSSLPKGEHIYLEGRCLHYGSSMPYLPILDAFRTYLGIKEGESESVIRQKMQERIVGSDESLTRCLLPIQELFSIQVDDEGFTKLEPKQKREKTFEAIRDILIRGSQTRPLVMAIEDLHWIDKTTEEFLDYMIGWLPGSRMLLILLYRPEYTHQWGSKSYYSRVGVGQLSSNTSAELVQAILEGGAVVPELRELILSRAAGNPFFMEELTHSLLENGSVQKEEGQYILVKNASEMQVPDTVQGIIAARMDRLEESLKRIMQVASVIGREFAFRILHAITEMKEDLKSNLLNLQGLEFIYEKSLFPDLEYIFRHALTQEVAYNSLLVKRRKEIHERIGRAIEQLYPERLEEFYAMLAYHYSRSENCEKACNYLTLSGDKAMRNNSVREAFRSYREALTILRQKAETDANRKSRLQIVCCMLYPMKALAFPEDSLELLKEGEALAADLGDPKTLALLQGGLGLYYLLSGTDPSLGKEYLEKGLPDAELDLEVELAVPVANDLINSYCIEGTYWKVCRIAPQVISLIERAKAEHELSGGLNRYSYLVAVYGMSLGFIGRFSEGEPLLNSGLSFASRIESVPSIAAIEMFYGSFWYARGDGLQCAKHYESAIEYLEKSQLVVFLGLVWGWLGGGYLLLEDPERAFQCAKKGLEIHNEVGAQFWLGAIHYNLSWAHLELGNLDEAREHGELAVNLCQKRNEKYFEGLARVNLGRVLAAANEKLSDEATELIAQGITILDELQVRPACGLAHLRFGELHTEAGNREMGMESLKRAESMFQEMGMDYWLGKAREVLARL